MWCIAFHSEKLLTIWQLKDWWLYHQFLDFVKGLCEEVVDLKISPFKQFVIGLITALKFLANLPWKDARPWKLFASSIDCGMGQSTIASTLSRYAYQQLAETTEQSRTTFSHMKEHFFKLTYCFFFKKHTHMCVCVLECTFEPISMSSISWRQGVGNCIW